MSDQNLPGLPTGNKLILVSMGEIAYCDISANGGMVWMEKGRGVTQGRR